jgi:protein TonB
MPAYPVPARVARVHGVVGVQVVIDETGRVVSAHAVSGPALLRAAAIRAAHNARFAPTLLNNQPVPVQGIINYNFKLE